MQSARASYSREHAEERFGVLFLASRGTPSELNTHSHPGPPRPVYYRLHSENVGGSSSSSRVWDDHVSPFAPIPVGQ